MNIFQIYHFVLCISVVLHSFQIDVPSNFHGSSEVFSGYLSNSEKFIEAFTLHDDHVSISGSVREVEFAISNISTKGMTMCVFDIVGLFAKKSGRI